MVTQLQTYNGNNILNNRVIVDYTKNTVHFEAVPGQTLFRSVFADLVHSAMTMGSFFVWPAVIGLLMQKIDIEISQIITYYVATAMLWSIVVVICIQAVKWTSKKWRHDRMPGWNHEQYQRFMFGIRWRKIKNEKQIFRLEQYRNNMYVLPNFKNVMLKYAVTGDHATYLKQIRIENYFKEQDDMWCVLFIYKKKPYTGQLEIEYW